MNIGDRVRVTIQKNGCWHDVKTGTFLGWTKSGKAKLRLHALPYGSISHRYVRNYDPRNVTLDIEEVTNERVTRALPRRGHADAGPTYLVMKWQPIATAPLNRDLELAVIKDDRPHALVFPCHRVLEGWVNAKIQKPVTVYPTHWRDWQQTPKEATPPSVHSRN